MNNPMGLEGHTILVTGAAQGIGRAVAQHAAELGARVAINDMNADGLAETSDLLGRDDTLIHVGSVADAGFVEQMVNDTVKQAGAIHGLVNNAGIVRAAMIHKMPLQTWQEVIDVNLTGVYLCLQAVGRHIIDRRKDGDTAPGRIVNVSSIAGRRGTIGQINYGAAKSGVLGLTMSAAREWGRHDINVNSVAFGLVETPMTETIRGEKFRDQYMASIPLGRFSTPEEVATPVCFLLGGGASYITGQHLTIDGGSHIGF
ncbi:SDR family NAD(P)-dependent oxidoreductase [Minwuia sp.]|uniref:SDR family NAD(P)-dependent oxidoreductase n=1 Tax=Minwuia sp. TaxID=2493630 RepID=UPI003A8D1A7D